MLFFLVSSLTYSLSLGEHLLGDLYDHYHPIPLHLKLKPQSSLFWGVLTPPGTFISMVVFSKPSGLFEMRFGRKTQCNIKLPYLHQWKEYFAEPGGKPEGVWLVERSPTKGILSSLMCLLSLWLMRLPSCLFVVFIYDPLLCLFFLSLSILAELGDAKFGVWGMRLQKANNVFGEGS